MPHFFKSNYEQYLNLICYPSVMICINNMKISRTVKTARQAIRRPLKVPEPSFYIYKPSNIKSLTKLAHQHTQNNKFHLMKTDKFIVTF